MKLLYLWFLLRNSVETRTFLFITLTLLCIADYKIDELTSTLLQMPNVPFKVSSQINEG